MSGQISTMGTAIIRHRDGNNYRAANIELRERMVIAEAQRIRVGGTLCDPRRYAWPTQHVTIAWDPEEQS